MRKLFGRDERIRTFDHLNPIQVLYQTEPHPEVANLSIHLKMSIFLMFEFTHSKAIIATPKK